MSSSSFRPTGNGVLMKSLGCKCCSTAVISNLRLFVRFRHCYQFSLNVDWGHTGYVLDIIPSTGAGVVRHIAHCQWLGFAQHHLIIVYQVLCSLMQRCLSVQPFRVDILYPRIFLLDRAWLVWGEFGRSRSVELFQDLSGKLDRQCSVDEGVYADISS